MLIVEMLKSVLKGQCHEIDRYIFKILTFNQ